MEHIDWTYMDLERSKLAKEIVDLQYRKTPKLKEYGLQGYKKSIEDAELNLQYLFNAYRYKNDDLFLNYIDWAQKLFTSIGLPESMLIDFLGLTQVVIQSWHGKGVLHEPLVKALNELLASSIQHVSMAKQNSSAAPRHHSVLPEYYQTYSRLAFEGQRIGLKHLFTQMQKDEISIESIYGEILEPFQRELGDLWHLREISVAQEHFATAMSQYAMTLLYDQIFSTPRVHRSMIGACVESELHEFGIRMVSDYFEYSGWDTHFYGANVPKNDLITAISEQKPDIIMLSCTMPFHIEQLEQLIINIRALQLNIPIFVGGYALDTLPGLWKKINADIYTSNFRDALKQANWIYEAKKGD